MGKKIYGQKTASTHCLTGRPLTGGGRDAVHMLGYWVCSLFLLPQDLYFTVRDDGASESAAKWP